MRIVAGEWRGRILKAPADARVRPTADRVREAWMSILQPAIPGARVLDLFAGSGALGLEALSRGAEHCHFVELSARSLDAIRANAATLGAGDRATIVRGDAVRFVSKLDAGAFDIAFVDPPYGLDLARQIVERWQYVPFATTLSIEHSSKERLDGAHDTRKYGDTALSFFHVEP